MSYLADIKCVLCLILVTKIRFFLGKTSDSIAITILFKILMAILSHFRKIMMKGCCINKKGEKDNESISFSPSKFI